MRIGRPLLKLPVRFCGEALAREVSALPADAWIAHPQKFDGNIAVPLVSPDGLITNKVSGPMGPTQWLNQCPYIREIMQALDSTWGRSRLMGLEAGAVVPEHVDIHYYWRTHLRIHIPVITNPKVAFCAGESIHMQAGECWLLDSFFKHSVVNDGPETRIHLVLDTVGGSRLWDLIAEAKAGSAEEKLIRPGETNGLPISFEQINSPLVMSPWEMQAHVAYVAEWTEEQPGRDEILSILDRFVMTWGGAWARYGPSDEGVPAYSRHLKDVARALASVHGRPVTLRNGRLLVDTVGRLILANALAPELKDKSGAESADLEKAPLPRSVALN